MLEHLSHWFMQKPDDKRETSLEDRMLRVELVVAQVDVLETRVDALERKVDEAQQSVDSN